MLQVMLLRAYATLEEQIGGACLEALAAQAQEQLPHLEPRHLSNVLWAFAKLKHSPDAALLRGSEARATRTVASFTPQDLVRCRYQADKFRHLSMPNFSGNK